MSGPMNRMIRLFFLVQLLLLSSFGPLDHPEKQFGLWASGSPLFLRLLGSRTGNKGGVHAAPVPDDFVMVSANSTAPMGEPKRGLRTVPGGSRYCEHKGDCEAGEDCVGDQATGGMPTGRGDGNLCCPSGARGSKWDPESRQWYCGAGGSSRGSSRGRRQDVYVAGVRLVARDCDCTDGLSSRLSENRVSLRECAAACRENGECKYFIHGKGEKSGRCMWQMGGCSQCSPDNYDAFELIENQIPLPSDVTLKRYGVECVDAQGQDHKLPSGDFNTCLDACRKTEGCNYFIHGYRDKMDRCYWEERVCEKYEPDDYNLYQIHKKLNLPAGVKLLKKGSECVDAQGQDHKLDSGTLEDCAKQCARQPGCQYFIHGYGDKKDRCFWEERECEKMEADDYNLYRMVSRSANLGYQKAVTSGTRHNTVLPHEDQLLAVVLAASGSLLMLLGF